MRGRPRPRHAVLRAFLLFKMRMMLKVGASLRHHWQQSSGNHQLRLVPPVSSDGAAAVRHVAAGLECLSFENKSNGLPLNLCTSPPQHLCASAPLRLCASAPLRLCASAPLRLCASAPLHLCASAFCLLSPASRLLPSVCLCLLASAIWFLPLPSSAIILPPGSCLCLPPPPYLLPPASCLLPVYVLISCFAWQVKVSMMGSCSCRIYLDSIV